MGAKQSDITNLVHPLENAPTPIPVSVSYPTVFPCDLMNRRSKLFLGLCYTSNGPSTVLPREGGEYETKKMEEHETETVCKRKNEERER